MRRILVPICLLLVLASSSPGARQEFIVEQSISSEYPADDVLIRSLQLMGERAKAAETALQKAPDRSATFDLLLKAGRRGDALDVLERIVERRPEEMRAAFAAIGSAGRDFAADKARDHAQRLRGLVERAKARLAALPRDEAARVARALVSVESELAIGTNSNPWRQLLAAFVSEYAETPEAALARVDVLASDYDRRGAERVAALEAFAREHPGTIAGAKALHQIGFDLAHNAIMFGEREGSDPTGRFFRLMDIVNELRSGRYPASEWVDKALSLALEFRAYKPSYSAANVKRMLDAYDALLPAIAERFEHDPNDGLSLFASYRYGLGLLFPGKADALAHTEDAFSRLERMVRNPDRVRLERADFYVRSAKASDEGGGPAVRAKGIALLDSLVNSASGFGRRKALATLARLRFGDGDDAAAGPLYRAYVADYPDSPYAWVAALRAAECEESSAPARAADLFRAAAQRYAANPPARVLGHAYAARALEAAANFGGALAEYRAAADSWDRDYGERYSLYSRRQQPPENPFEFVDPAQVTREDLRRRTGDLDRALSVRGGESIARARWLLGRSRWNDAAAAAASFVTAHPSSPLAAEARFLGNRARLETALELVDAEAASPDLDGAFEALKTLEQQPPDFAVIGALITRATLLRLLGKSAEAEPLMAQAMRGWAALDRGAKQPARRTDVARDVVDIRNAVFRPRGDGVFANGHGWNAFRWESASSPHYVVNPVLRVKRHDGETEQVTAYDPFPAHDNVLFLDPDRRLILERIIRKIGGSKRRPWTQVMQTPNRPAGPSLEVLAFWKPFFFVQPGHWGGWVFETYPIVTEIEFVDAARTRAAVKVTVGYSGCTVQLAKKNGAWVATELTNFWIT